MYSPFPTIVVQKLYQLIAVIGDAAAAGIAEAVPAVIGQMAQGKAAGRGPVGVEGVVIVNKAGSFHLASGPPWIIPGKRAHGPVGSTCSSWGTAARLSM